MIGIVAYERGHVSQRTMDCTYEEMMSLMEKQVREIQYHPVMNGERLLVIWYGAGDDARDYLWNKEFERMTEEQQWMIKTTIPDYHTVERKGCLVKPSKLHTFAAHKLFQAGFKDDCPRCGGVGRWSYNHRDGDRCWGCNGNKYVLPKLTSEKRLEIERHFNIIQKG